MTENEKNLAIATFRFGVISEFVTGVRLNHGDKERLIKDKVGRSYDIPYSTRTAISRSAIKQWVLDYQRAGYRIEGLFPKRRIDAGKTRALDPSLRIAILEMKRANPNWTVPVIINKLKHNKILSPNAELSTTSIYRLLKHEKINARSPNAVDRRKFEAEYPNVLWQSDVMHGPKVIADGKKRKTYLCAMLDDHSRLITHGQFFSTERIESLHETLRHAVAKRGLPQKLYVDNGSCYRAIFFEQVCASLGLALLHAKPYQPQGKGKIERFFRNVRDSFLPFCKKEETLTSINDAFEKWLDEYNNTVHSATKMTPIARFQKNLSCVRPAPPDLLNYFRILVPRTVRKDRTVQLKNRIYEVAVGLIDKKVELRYHEDDLSKVEVFFNSQSFGFANLTDIHVNSTAVRDSDSGSKKIESGKLFERSEDE